MGTWTLSFATIAFIFQTVSGLSSIDAGPMLERWQNELDNEASGQFLQEDQLERPPYLEQLGDLASLPGQLSSSHQQDVPSAGIDEKTEDVELPVFSAGNLRTNEIFKNPNLFHQKIKLVLDGKNSEYIKDSKADLPDKSEFPLDSLKNMLIDIDKREQENGNPEPRPVPLSKIIFKLSKLTEGKVTDGQDNFSQEESVAQETHDNAEHERETTKENIPKTSLIEVGNSPIPVAHIKFTIINKSPDDDSYPENTGPEPYLRLLRIATKRDFTGLNQDNSRLPGKITFRLPKITQEDDSSPFEPEENRQECSSQEEPPLIPFLPLSQADLPIPQGIKDSPEIGPSDVPDMPILLRRIIIAVLKGPTDKQPLPISLPLPYGTDDSSSQEDPSQSRFLQSLLESDSQDKPEVRAPTIKGVVLKSLIPREYLAMKELHDRMKASASADAGSQVLNMSIPPAFARKRFQLESEIPSRIIRSRYSFVAPTSSSGFQPKLPPFLFPDNKPVKDFRNLYSSDEHLELNRRLQKQFARDGSFTRLNAIYKQFPPKSRDVDSEQSGLPLLMGKYPDNFMDVVNTVFNKLTEDQPSTGREFRFQTV